MVELGMHVSCSFISVYILLKAVFYLAERALFGLDISYSSLSLVYGFLAASLNK